MNRNAAAGFTMIEMLTTVVIVSALAAMAVPGFAGMLARQRQSSATAELHTLLMSARSEALDRGKRVALCPSSDAQTCNGSRNWSGGYVMFVDSDNDRQHQRSEPLLQVIDPQPRVEISSTVGRPVIIFHPDGSSAGFNATFTVCAPGMAQPASTLVLSNSGRLRAGHGDPCTA